MRGSKVIRDKDNWDRRGEPGRSEADSPDLEFQGLGDFQKG